MQLILFWKDWPKTYCYILLFFLVLFFASLAWMLLNHVLGIHFNLDWNILAEGDKASVIIDQIQIGPFNLTQTVESPLFYQKFSGTSIQIPIWSYYVFLALIAFAATTLIAIISSLSRYWFYIGIGLFALFLVSLKLELLLLFDSNEKIGLIAAFVLYLPTAYFFNSIRPGTSLLTRFATFLCLTITLGLFIFFSSTIQSPFFYLATSLTTPATILSLIFIMGVGHEIIAGFAYLLFGTKANSTKNSTFHFLIISLIFLGNVVLAYLHESGVVNWDILYLNIFILLSVSSVLGIWGFRHRENQYSYVMKFIPSGGIVYLAIAIICFVTIAHFYAIGNDAGLEIFRDFILFSHMAYGLIFILYILANFSGLLKSDLAIYKVIYKPTSMPYFTFRFAGLIIVLAFVFKANWKVPVFQNAASNYNAVADYHLKNGEKLLAQKYYREAAEYALNNHKSNYSLAILHERENEIEKAIVRYKAAISKWPSEQAFINLVGLYEHESRFFDALFTSLEAKETFDKSNIICNRLGLIYGSTHVTDSSIYYLDKAAKLAPEQGSSVSNILAILAKNEIKISIDSLLKEFEIKGDPVSINNRLVLNNVNGQNTDYSFELSDSALSPIDATLLTNASINALFKKDTFDISLLNTLADYSANINYREAIQYLECLHLYKNQRVNEAFRKLNWMANTSKKIASKYFDDVGLWALEQGAPDIASQYFQWAMDRNYGEAKLHLAIALTENREIDRASKLWFELTQSTDSELEAIASKMLWILQSKRGDYSEWADNDKYFYLKYKADDLDSVLFKILASSIADDNYRAQAILDQAKKYWSMDQVDKAVNTYSLLTDVTITDGFLFEEIQFFELNMLAARGEIRGLANKINQGVEFTEERNLEKAYYSAIIAEASNDTIQAKKHYQYLYSKNPFYEEATIAAARFIGKTDPFEAYSQLLDAVEVNPSSIKLLEAYIYQCGIIQQNTSAEIALESLEKLVSSEKYSSVEANYSELKRTAEETY